MSETEMVRLGDVIHRYTRQQTQYGSRYAFAGPGETFEGRVPYLTGPDFGDGRTLHITGDSNDYHSVQIAAADAHEFARRVLTYRFQSGQISYSEMQEGLESIAQDLGEDDVLLSIDQVAQAMNVSEHSVYNLVRDGQLKLITRAGENKISKHWMQVVIAGYRADVQIQKFAH